MRRVRWGEPNGEGGGRLGPASIDPTSPPRRRAKRQRDSPVHADDQDASVAGQSDLDGAPSGSLWGSSTGPPFQTTPRRLAHFALEGLASNSSFGSRVGATPDEAEAAQALLLTRQSSRSDSPELSRPRGEPVVRFVRIGGQAHQHPPSKRTRQTQTRVPHQLLGDLEPQVARLHEAASSWIEARRLLRQVSGSNRLPPPSGKPESPLSPPRKPTSVGVSALESEGAPLLPPPKASSDAGSDLAVAGDAGLRVAPASPNAPPPSIASSGNLLFVPLDSQQPVDLESLAPSSYLPIGRPARGDGLSVSWSRPPSRSFITELSRASGTSAGHEKAAVDSILLSAFPARSEGPPRAEPPRSRQHVHFAEDVQVQEHHFPDRQSQHDMDDGASNHPPPSPTMDDEEYPLSSSASALHPNHPSHPSEVVQLTPEHMHRVLLLQEHHALANLNRLRALVISAASRDLPSLRPDHLPDHEPTQVLATTAFCQELWRLRPPPLAVPHIRSNQ
jgi:hypothetical protein